MSNKGEQGWLGIPTGKRLGRHSIVRFIAPGSADAVYEAIETEVLDRDHVTRAQAGGGFRGAPALSAGARPTHVVDPPGVGSDPAVHYPMMSLLSGEDLACRLGRCGPLGTAEAVDILLPVCIAVAAAHDNGIIHGELKPSSIFLAVRDRRMHATVLNFGVGIDAVDPRRSGALDDEPTEVSPGIRRYLAPEQSVDLRLATALSDQYALGVILYECVTGLHPFKGNDVDASFRLLHESEPRWASAVRSEIPVALDKVILKALEREPLERFASVIEFAQSLLPFASRQGRRSWKESLAPAKRHITAFSAVAWRSASRRRRSSVSLPTTARRSGASSDAEAYATEMPENEDSRFVSEFVRQVISERANALLDPPVLADREKVGRILAKIARRERRIRIAVGILVSIVLAVSGAVLLRGSWGHR